MIIWKSEWFWHGICFLLCTSFPSQPINFAHSIRWRFGASIVSELPGLMMSPTLILQSVLFFLSFFLTRYWMLIDPFSRNCMIKSVEDHHRASFSTWRIFSKDIHKRWRWRNTTSGFATAWMGYYIGLGSRRLRWPCQLPWVMRGLDWYQGDKRWACTLTGEHQCFAFCGYYWRSLPEVNQYGLTHITPNIPPGLGWFCE